MTRELSEALLVWLRTLPLGLALAGFTRGFVPVPIALSSTLALTAVLLPLSGSLEAELGSAALAVSALRELSIGAAFALALTLSLQGAHWAVHLSDAGELHAELRRTLAVPYALCAAWLVLSLRAPLAIVVGFAESFRDAPLGGRVFSAREFAFGVAQLFGDALATAIGFALPLLVSVWLVSLSLGLLRRVLAPRSLAPQPALSGALLTLAAALLLVPIASRTPEGVRRALTSARALTRALSK